MIIMSKPIWIDQTLNAAVNSYLTSAQLEHIARLLSGLGMQAAGIYMPVWQQYCPDLSAVRQQLELWGIIDISAYDLKWLEQAGIKRVIMVARNICSDECRANLGAAISKASRLDLDVALLLEGLANLDQRGLAAVITEINSYSIKTVFYGDENGSGNYLTIFDQITLLKNNLHCPIGIRAGNAYGLATANTLAAMKAGARQVMTAVAGVGGFAPWEEALMAAKQFAGQDIVIPPALAGNCQQVLAALQLTVSANKAIIGPAIFAHESGLHVDGVNKDPWLYEPFAPELVGLSRQLIIGKHSGTTALKTKFASWGIQLEDVESKRLLASVRALSVRNKSAVSDDELQRLYLSG